MITPTPCSHSYLIPQQAGFGFCLLCKQTVLIPKGESTETLVMPPKIFGITEALWNQIRPWCSIAVEYTAKYQWYISILNSQEYLIMPVLRNGSPVYYSARRLGEGVGLKYLYPKGVKKLPWMSTNKLEQDPIIICEGVADAVYCSQISSSVAVLGSYYDGSLDHLFYNRDIVVCLDGDTAGVIGAVNILKALNDVRSKRMVVLPNGKDPTDFNINELTQLIREDEHDKRRV